MNRGHALLASTLLAVAACAAPKPVATPKPVAPRVDRSRPTLRLPADVRPTAQSLVLKIDPSQPRFSGTVEISIALDAPRDVIWLHGKGLHVTRAVAIAAGVEQVGTWAQSDDSGIASLRVPNALPAGNAKLRIEYDAPFGPKLDGLYTVTQAGLPYAFTQFEPIGARYAFPCFDEPGWKISWDTTLIVPDTVDAVANTREIERKHEGGSLRLRFAATLPLPSYLIAFAVGPIEIVPAPDVPPNAVRKHPLPLRAITAKGRGKEVAYALAHTAEILAVLEEIAGSEYPYDKLDILAVPDKGGAMENAGAVTFADQLLLIDEKTAPMQQKRRYAEVMAHELAHQWTGDLVTAAWWDDIWLNEAFATWLGTKAADKWNPKTDAAADLFDSIQGAMATDGLVSARAIRQRIESTNDIENAFDNITYRKGGGVLAMFERWVGPETFRRGFVDYLAKHRFGNATADDFLDAESLAAGKDVKTPFRTFLDQPGVPFIEAHVSCDGKPRLELKQSRYLPMGSSGDTHKTWQVPVCARYAVGKEIAEACTLLKETEGSLPLGDKCPDWVFPNSDGAGYLRFSLAEADLAKLRDHGYRSLDANERVAYGNSLLAAFSRGTLLFKAAMEAAAPLATDSSHSVVDQPMGLLSIARDWLFEDPSRAKVEAYARKLFHGPYTKVGWKAQKSEDTEQVQLQAALVRFLAFTARDPAVLAEGRKLGLAFLGYKKDGVIHPGAVDKNLTASALMALGEGADRPLWDFVRAQLGKTDDGELRGKLVMMLSSARKPELVTKARDLVFDPALRTTEVLVPILMQMRQPELRESTWQWVKASFDRLLTVVPAHHSQTQLIAIGQVFCDEAHARDIEAFFTPARIAKIDGGPRILASTLETVRLCAVKRAAQEPSARALFK